MKYSIIIPALNEEKLLAQLLKQIGDSVKREKYNYEIIVSDGGSKDKTVELAQKYADKVVLANNSERQNIAKGRNLGASMAEGEVLIFINADILLPLQNDRFFHYLEDNFYDSKYDAFTCKVCIFLHEQIFSDIIFHFIYNNYFRLLNMLGVGMGRGECQVIRKEIFDKVGGYNVTLAAGEDFDLFRRIKNAGSKILYSFKICVYESPRRFRKYGYLNVTLNWVKNGLSVLINNKSISKEWQQVR